MKDESKWFTELLRRLSPWLFGVLVITLNGCSGVDSYKVYSNDAKMLRTATATAYYQTKNADGGDDENKPDEPKPGKCENCNGTGELDGDGTIKPKCPVCNGKGYIERGAQPIEQVSASNDKNPYPDYNTCYEKSMVDRKRISVYTGSDPKEAERLKMDADKAGNRFTWPGSKLKFLKTNIYEPPNEVRILDKSFNAGRIT